VKFKKDIKKCEVLVDREIGEAYITVTLYCRHPKVSATRITERELQVIAQEGGADMISVISGNPITNARGEVTGKWTIKIPSTEPENSTTAILRRRQKRKKKAE